MRSPDGLTASWDVTGEGEARTRYTVLRWDDVVRAHFPTFNHRHVVTIPTLWWRLIRTGYSSALRREGRRFSRVIFGVHLIWVATLLVVLAAVLALVFAVGTAHLHPAALVAIGVAIGLGLLPLAVSGLRGKPLYVAHLIEDTRFTHLHAAGPTGPLAERLQAFASLLDEARREADEVLVVGHSSGSFLAVELLDRALARHPDLGRVGAPVTLLTIGNVIPWLALDPVAVPFRSALAHVASAEQVRWFDVVARWDALSFHDRDPISASGLASPHPDRISIVDAPLGQFLDPARMRGVRFNLFRLHFLTLMAGLSSKRFDYIRLIEGRRPVADQLQEWSRKPTGTRL